MAWLLLFFSGNLLMAAVPGDFNPSNPPEPMANFKVVTKCSTNAYTSGDGTYASGSGGLSEIPGFHIQHPRYECKY
mgnify:CR=1 FL=1